MKSTLRSKIFILLALFWMGVIFFFSSRNADISTQDSYEVGLFVGRAIIPGFEKKSEAQQIEFAAKIDHPVRKTAHATEYAILGGLLLGAFYHGRKREGILAWGVAALYAASDEAHQLFVPGRSGQISDVILDACAAAAAIGVIFLCLQIASFHRSASKPPTA